LKHRQNVRGFTLSELLVSLAVLGLIAAFGIPKILSAVDEKAHKAAAKEAMGMIAGAHASWIAENGGILGSTTTATDLSKKMNYVKSETLGSGNPTMLTLHSGATISFAPNDSFKAMNPGVEGVVRFNVDPDGGRTAVPPPGPGPVSVNLGYDGKMWFHYNDYDTGFDNSANTHAFTQQADAAGAFQGEIAIAQPSTVDGFYTTWMKN
jgi:prepilin-type N-terminal cleavage/methylation domain-containing protein